jgi:hypothetical protein
MQIVPQRFFTLMTEMIRQWAKRETPPDRADGGMTRGLQSSGDRAAKTQTGLK